MTKWVRFEHEDKIRIGRLEGDMIEIYRGSIFSSPVSIDDEIPLEAVQLLAPVSPKNFLGLWNNFHQCAKEQDLQIPAHPLYFVKTSSCLLHSGGIILRPGGYAGEVVFAAELGVVIGRRCYQVNELAAADHIFGYTCVNDVTAGDWLNTEPNFTQWTRAKSCPTFGAIGPVIATRFNPGEAHVIAKVNGETKQNYSISDMIFSPQQIVSAISQDMTLFPGDVIACGTCLGTGGLPVDSVVEVIIEGIGVLRNYFGK
jgi:2-keto-4-pentenoate hydratase/2-oxohepta-3-ene-1,7-dioic acid hydratase in catechol pathway